MIKSIIFLQFLFTVLFVSCSVKSNINNIKINNPIVEANQFVDSLRNVNKSDTILTFYKGCSGCVQGYPYNLYVIWIKNNIVFMKRFSERGSFNVSTIDNIFKYYFINEKSILKEEMTHNESELLHYKYSELKIYHDSNYFTYSVTDETRMYNLNSKRVVLIILLESVLYNNIIYSF